MVADVRENISVLVSPRVHHEFDHQELGLFREALSLTQADTEGIITRLVREANGDHVLLDLTAAD